MKRKTITRTEAKKHAGVFLLRSMLRGAQVKDGGKVRWSPSYGARQFDTRNVWLIFLRRHEDELNLRSSEVIAVCKNTGEVLYQGSANDEG